MLSGLSLWTISLSGEFVNHKSLWRIFFWILLYLRIMFLECCVRFVIVKHQCIENFLLLCLQLNANEVFGASRSFLGLGVKRKTSSTSWFLESLSWRCTIGFSPEDSLDRCSCGSTSVQGSDGNRFWPIFYCQHVVVTPVPVPQLYERVFTFLHPQFPPVPFLALIFGLGIWIIHPCTNGSIRWGFRFGPEGACRFCVIRWLGFKACHFRTSRYHL